MNEAQMKKVREIVGKISSRSAKPDVGGWVEKDYVYLFVKSDKVAWETSDTRLYAIDREGSVAIHRNYAPLQLRDDTLIMSCPGQTSVLSV
jgi:hypothetical protein